MKIRVLFAIIIAVGACGCNQEFWTGKKKEDPQQIYKATVGEINIQINNGHLSEATRVAEQLVSQVESNYGPTHAYNVSAYLELGSLKPRQSVECIALFEKALSIQESIFGATSHEAGVIHAHLGQTSYALEAYAFPHLETAIKHLKPRENPDGYAGVAFVLSDIQEKQFDFVGCQDTRRKAIETLKLHTPSTPEYRLDLMSAMALTYEQIGRYQDSEMWYSQIIQIFTNNAQLNREEYINALRQFSTIAYRQNSIKKSRDAIIAALQTSRSLYGENSIRTIPVLVDQASIEESLGNKDKAQGIREDISRILEGYNATDKDDILALLADPNLDALASAYSAQGKHEQAKNAVRQILAIRERKYGKQSPQLIEVLDSLATLEMSLGGPKAAESLYGQIDAIVAGMPEDNVLPRISHHLTLGDFCISELQVLRAEDSYKKALELAMRSYPINDPIVDRCFNSLVSCYQTESKYADLELLLKTRISALAAKLGERHKDLAPLHQQLASVYRTIGDAEGAKSSYQNYMENVEDHIGDANAQTANTLLTMAEIYSAQGATTEAESVYSRLVPIYQKVYGFDHWRIGRCLFDLAMMQTDATKAMPNLKRALDIYEKSFGSNHPFLSPLLSNYAQTAAYAGDQALANRLNNRAVQIQKLNKMPLEE